MGGGGVENCLELRDSKLPKLVLTLWSYGHKSPFEVSNLISPLKRTSYSFLLFGANKAQFWSEKKLFIVDVGKRSAFQNFKKEKGEEEANELIKEFVTR